jgi:hypothetical protein
VLFWAVLPQLVPELIMITRANNYFGRFCHTGGLHALPLSRAVPAPPSVCRRLAPHAPVGTSVTSMCWLLHSPKQQGDVYTETTCCTRMFQVFQVFYRYITSVLYRCCKSRSECYTYCNAIYVYFMCMFQMSVSDLCYKCFIWML